MELLPGELFQGILVGNQQVYPGVEFPEFFPVQTNLLFLTGLFTGSPYPMENIVPRLEKYEQYENQCTDSHESAETARSAFEYFL